MIRQIAMQLADKRHWRLRLQLVFLYVAQTTLSFSEIVAMQSNHAPDRWETAYLATTPWSINDKETRTLLLSPIGSPPNTTSSSDLITRGVPAFLASNHAPMALLQSLIFADGTLVVTRGIG